MARRKDNNAETIAAQITRWRNEGLTDAQIVAQHGDGDLQRGFQWLEDNPGTTPEAAATTTQSRPANPPGSSYEPAMLPLS